jgi:hypothetical protein
VNSWAERQAVKTIPNSRKIFLRIIIISFS